MMNKADLLLCSIKDPTAFMKALEVHLAKIADLPSEGSEKPDTGAHGRPAVFESSDAQQCAVEEFIGRMRDAEAVSHTIPASTLIYSSTWPQVVQDGFKLLSGSLKLPCTGEAGELPAFSVPDSAALSKKKLADVPLNELTTPVRGAVECLKWLLYFTQRPLDPACLRGDTVVQHAAQYAAREMVTTFASVVYGLPVPSVRKYWKYGAALDSALTRDLAPLIGNTFTLWARLLRIAYRRKHLLLLQATFDPSQDEKKRVERLQYFLTWSGWMGLSGENLVKLLGRHEPVYETKVVESGNKKTKQRVKTDRKAYLPPLIATPAGLPVTGEERTTIEKYNRLVSTQFIPCVQAALSEKVCNLTAFAQVVKDELDKLYNVSDRVNSLLSARLRARNSVMRRLLQKQDEACGEEDPQKRRNRRPSAQEIAERNATFESATRGAEKANDLGVIPQDDLLVGWKARLIDPWLPQQLN